MSSYLMKGRLVQMFLNPHNYDWYISSNQFSDLIRLLMMQYRILIKF